MDGVEFVGRLRHREGRELCRTPVVIMTGMPYHARSLLQPNAADGMLVKPSALRDLLGTLAHFAPRGPAQRLERRQGDSTQAVHSPQSCTTTPTVSQASARTTAAP
ncbi:MAG TPA: response regulator [Anaeromyxobacteraceae bacterium]|nr:response regulator [Anaeromyxobacteraceae bacterium]